MDFGLRARNIPFRFKLAGLVGFAVLVTLVTVLVPVYRQQRTDLIQLQGERLAAIARTTAAALPADALDTIAGRAGQNTAAFVNVRAQLRRLWIANGGATSELANGIAVVRRESGTWRWPIFMFAYMTVLAYVTSLGTFQLARVLGWGGG